MCFSWFRTFWKLRSAEASGDSRPSAEVGGLGMKLHVEMAAGGESCFFFFFFISLKLAASLHLIN